MDVTTGVPFFYTATQAGALYTMSVEFNLNAALSGPYPGAVIMITPDQPATFANPAWNAATMAFFGIGVGTTKSGSTAPCNTKAGVTFAVTGHPEAVITYVGGGTTTSMDGGAWGTIVTTGTAAAPEYMTITASKPGCKLTLGGDFGSFFVTGRNPFARGSSTNGGTYEISN